jgi:hypothetical protein
MEKVSAFGKSASSLVPTVTGTGTKGLDAAAVVSQAIGKIGAGDGI